VRNACCSVLSLLAAGCFWVAPLYPQSSPAPATCSTVPSAVEAFSIERTVLPSDIATTYSTIIPANILASLAVGALEIRERLIYNPQENSLTSTVFLVEPGSPSPTPINVDISTGTLASYTISINHVYTSCAPVPSLLFAGTVTSSAGSLAVPNGIYNLKLEGATATVSIGYTTDSPPKINNVVVLVAGLVATYSSAGAGTLTFQTNPVTPPGQNGTTIVLSINGQLLNLPLATNTPIQLLTRVTALDASKSTDASGGAVSFQWSAHPPVAFTPGANAPAIVLQFPGRGASTTITLTVTGSEGSSTVTIPLLYTGP
jgi:hypothetical protein